MKCRHTECGCFVTQCCIECPLANCILDDPKASNFSANAFSTVSTGTTVPPNECGERELPRAQFG